MKNLRHGIEKHLVNEDEEWDRCLKEATQVQFPTALCELFSFICIYHKNTKFSSIIPNMKKVFLLMDQEAVGKVIYLIF